MKRGFTLVEILLSLVIISALLGISIPVFLQLNVRSDVNSAQTLIEVALRKAQANARNQRNNTNWGVYIDSPNDQITIYAGTNMLTRDSSFDERFSLPNQVVVNNGAPQEITFSQLTGDIVGLADVSVVITNNDVTQTLIVDGNTGSITDQ